MGSGHSMVDARKSQEEANKRIENEIVTSRKEQIKIRKLLLLGAAECGKSTVLKQMRIIHDFGFNREEVALMVDTIHSNVLQAMCAMLQASKDLNIPLKRNALKHAEIIRDFVQNGEPFPPFPDEIFVALKNLWMDAGIQECYKRRNEYILNESAKFFLDTIDRISRDDYIPNNQDMLYARVPTSSIVEIKFIIKGITFRVFDVGGQRTERRKWIHCFDNVNAIIFISAMSEYDQFLAEDKNMNRMKESLSIFKQIVNNKVFPDVCAMILFLNKKDLFAEKIKRTSIKTAFSNYQGGNGYEEQASYVSERFLAKNTNPKKQIYLHFTCATDTNQVQVVLDSVVDIMMRKNVTNAGLLS